MKPIIGILLLSLAPVFCLGAQDPPLAAPAEGHVLVGDSLIFLFSPSLYNLDWKIKSVAVQGYFNSWNPKDKDWQLDDSDGDGIWSLVIPDGGKYQGYRFRYVVNGRILLPPEETESQYVYRNSDGEEELLIGGQNENPWLSRSREGSLSLPDGRVLPYRIILPENYDPSAKYPLVLFYHGMGERGKDNVLTLAPCNGAYEFLETASRKHQFIMIVPQCPLDSWWIWFDRKPAPALSGALRLLDETIEAYPVDETRIYVTGLSMGGFAAWETAFRRPQIFAAGMVLCGGYFASIVPAIKNIPFSVYHGKNDPTSPVAASRSIVRALKKAGGTVNYNELDDGHDIWIEVYSDPEAIDWLFQQHKP